ncbi:TIGR03792 family protein [Gloeothece verrucosa]|uniref:ABM domain-containing protein n=1 Tax=Gloeothece verrucosa (strain PCC 7822) TaxID=497965 RepID=E0UBW9_GLOV7|nr:TIGR03792 family protein [Gloeothece verrucosa]ADN15184.1 conserved hypothetical protein [Gloeothece verrucosa PCC 7822]
MVIEWLKFRVPAQSREKFIQKDELIWTAALAKFKGFLGKEVWVNPKIDDEIVLVIHWENHEAWSSIPAAALEEIEDKFSQSMRNDEYKLIESGEYQVRKFIS